MLKEAKETNNGEILSDMIEHGAIDTVCRSIVEHSSRPSLCIEYIRLAGDILEEEDPEI